MALKSEDAVRVKDISDYIAAHFQMEGDRVRAAFIWTAENISYDVVNMFAINFYETTDDKIK